ncbi:MAG TPA: pepsin/retropepsin-like aspartic protease family protein [Chitinophagaceae bacterium]
MLFLRYAILLSFVLGWTAMAQGRPAADTTKYHIIIPGLDPVVSSDSATCVIPFSRAGNLILIRARADTTDGNFVLDTGAPGLVLNLTYFRQYSQLPDQDGEDGGITGTVNQGTHVMVDSFSLGGIHYYHTEADRINLGHIENSKHIKILGLLGMQLFKSFEMIIDYEKGLLYLHLVRKKEAATYKSELLRDTSAYRTVPIELADDKIIAYGETAGKRLKFVIDCAAESNVLDSRLSNKILEHVVVSGRVLLSGSGTTKVEALTGNLEDIRIGGDKIFRLPVLITNLEKMCFSYNNCIDGMLGFDFLSLHKIGFNFVSHKMYIWK